MKFLIMIIMMEFLITHHSDMDDANDCNGGSDYDYDDYDRIF